MKRRRRANPSTGDVAGFAIGLAIPAALVVFERANTGRNLLTGKNENPAPNDLTPSLGEKLDPLAFTGLSAAELVIVGLAAIMTSGWTPGVLRGAVVGSAVGLGGGIVLGIVKRATTPPPKP